jgi:hypothetical protein
MVLLPGLLTGRLMGMLTQMRLSRPCSPFQAWMSSLEGASCVEITATAALQAQGPRARASSVSCTSADQLRCAECQARPLTAGRRLVRVSGWVSDIAELSAEECAEIANSAEILLEGMP